MMDRKRAQFSTLGFIVVTMGIGVASLSIGGSSVGFQELVNWLSGGPVDPTTAQILSELRLSRTLTAFSVGAALALSGLFLQFLLDNPLAEPYTLGLSGGASLGAIVPVLLGLQPLSLTQPVGSLLGCISIGLLLAYFVWRQVLISPRALVLTGLMISLFSGSLVVLAMSLFEPSELFASLQWLMGFCGTQRDAWWPATSLVVVLALLWASLRQRAIDRLLLGDELLAGHSLKGIRFEILLVASLLTSLATAQMGLVGFVGIMGPQLAFIMVKSRRLGPTLLLSALCGGSLVVLADIFGRLIGGMREIPAGSLVSLVGAPFLVFLLFRRSRHVEN